MSQEQWRQVDTYLTDTLALDNPVLTLALEDSRAAGLPDISVSAQMGQFLNQLARIVGARRILEIGTLAGYSTIWLGTALPPDGKLVTLESRTRHAELANANLQRAGLSDQVDVRLGNAVDTLQELVDAAVDPFDLTFIDADKPRNPEYLSYALQLSGPGSVIVVDNVVRDGRIADTDSQAAGIVGTQAMLAMIRQNPRLTASAIQTVGNKGYDGFCLVTVE